MRTGGEDSLFPAGQATDSGGHCLSFDVGKQPCYLKSSLGEVSSFIRQMVL